MITTNAEAARLLRAWARAVESRLPIVSDTLITVAGDLDLNSPALDLPSLECAIAYLAGIQRAVETAGASVPVFDSARLRALVTHLRIVHAAYPGVVDAHRASPAALALADTLAIHVTDETTWLRQVVSMLRLGMPLPSLVRADAIRELRAVLRSHHRASPAVVGIAVAVDLGLLEAWTPVLAHAIGGGMELRHRGCAPWCCEEDATPVRELLPRSEGETCDACGNSLLDPPGAMDFDPAVVCEAHSDGSCSPDPAHRIADPHCTGNDCMAHHAAQEGAPDDDPPEFSEREGDDPVPGPPPGWETTGGPTD